MISENNKKIMDMVIKNPDNYVVWVDNDSVWVDKENDEDFYMSFDKFGYHLLVEIFDYLGINGQYV